MTEEEGIRSQRLQGSGTSIGFQESEIRTMWEQ